MEIFTGDDGTHLCAACHAERWKNAQPLVTIYDLGKEKKRSEK
jgi:hypothetical protein